MFTLYSVVDADMTLELLLPSETWNNDLLISPSTKETCLNLKSNVGHYSLLIFSFQSNHMYEQFMSFKRPLGYM